MKGVYIMVEIQDGYQNEFLIVLEFNNKKIQELNPMLREVIDDLFPSVDEQKVIKLKTTPINYRCSHVQKFLFRVEIYQFTS